jgi:hypothetical protein
VGPIPPGREHGKTLALLGGRKGQLVDGESSGTDSEEDEENSDDNKLAKIKHAISDVNQPVQVILNGRYQWEQGWESVSYCRTFNERKVLEDILEPLRITANAIGTMALEAGAVALPLPIQLFGIEREALEITVAKRGSGIQIYYERKDQKDLTTNHELKFRAMFWEGLSIVFGIGAPASNAEISARLKSVTASWFGDQFGPSWEVNLSAEPRTSELGNEIYATVLLSRDESWNGICRIPGLPGCAAPVPIATAATKEEEAVSLIQYAWRADWPIKGTTALIMDVGTDQAFEFSVTYKLGRLDVGPSWQNLCEFMWRAADEDGIVLPACVSRERLHYLASCEKVNQSVRVLWRQTLSDGTTPQIPRDHRLPVYSVYGTRAELKMRDIERLGWRVKGIVQALYGASLEVIPIQSQKWSFNAAMGRPEEKIDLPDEVAQDQGSPPNIPDFNDGIRESAEIVANVDKGFVHYIKRFRVDIPVSAVIRVEEGYHGEYGTLANRPEEEA